MSAGDNDTSKENEAQEDGLEDEDRAMAATPKLNGAKKDRQSSEIHHTD